MLLTRLERENKNMDKEKLRNQIEFLTKRDNKLQQIEQMFQNSIVDLSELSKLIKEN